MRLLFTVALTLGLSASLAAFDWGGSLEAGASSSLYPYELGKSSFSQSTNAKAWFSWWFTRDLTLTGRLSMGNAVSGTGNTFPNLTDALTPNLDNLAVGNGNWWVGRSAVRDFSRMVVNTSVDGAGWSDHFGNWELSTALGTTIVQLKSASNVVVSEADLNERSAEVKLNDPTTWWAPPRALALVEVGNDGLVPGTSLRAALVGQMDLRSKDIAKADETVLSGKNSITAPVSIGYLGLNASGKFVPRWYWNAWGYLGTGTTLTKGLSWKPTLIVNGAGGVDTTLLLPNLGNSVIIASVQAGSWDEDGKSPDQNAVKDGNATLYTGYFGISRSGVAQVFNPQLNNIVLPQLTWSVRPWGGSKGILDTLQFLTVTSVFVRPMPYGIAETGINDKSSDLYLGSEADLTVSLRPASDWGLSFSSAVFVPNESVLTRHLEASLQASANLSF